MFFIVGDKRVYRFDIAHKQVGCQDQSAERGQNDDTFFQVFLSASRQEA
jgi:hypothetical protein